MGERSLEDAYYEMINRSIRHSNETQTKQRTLASWMPQPQQYTLKRASKKSTTKLFKRPQLISNMLKRSKDNSENKEEEQKEDGLQHGNERHEEEGDTVLEPDDLNDFNMEDALYELNNLAKELFPDDPLTDGSPRWVLEPGFLRGYMACWTIQKGAELVTAVSIAVAQSSVKRKPDISLQWVGRQLWGLTIQIPRMRTGAVLYEHIELGKDIDRALSEAMYRPEESMSPIRTMATIVNNQVPSINAISNMREENRTVVISPKTRSNVSNEEEIEERDVDQVATTSRKSMPETNDILQREDVLENKLRTKSNEELSTIKVPSTLTSSFRSRSGINKKSTVRVVEYEDPFQRCVPEKTGWIKKKKKGRNAWNQRWFELKGNRLYYFASETDGIPRGAIILDKVIVRQDVDTLCFTITSTVGEPVRIIKFTNQLTHNTSGRKSYTLQADSREASQSWVESISRAAICCHLSLPLPPEKKSTFPLRDAQYVPQVQRYGSIRYLRETDPLLWEINPLDQMAIKKRASQASTESEFKSLLHKYKHVFQKIVLPPPRSISMEQTLRDIEPESFLINSVLYCGRKHNLDLVFEVLESFVKRFTAAHDERVNCVSAILQASARTNGGGDAYFVVRNLLGNPSLIIRPSTVSGEPIEIDASIQHPSQITVSIKSFFSFHHEKEVEKSTFSEPFLRLAVKHIQEFDFKLGKCPRSVSVLLAEKDLNIEIVDGL